MNEYRELLKTAYKFLLEYEDKITLYRDKDEYDEYESLMEELEKINDDHS